MPTNSDYSMKNSGQRMKLVDKFSAGQRNFLFRLKRHTKWISAGFRTTIAVLASVYLGIAIQRSVQESIWLMVIAAMFVVIVTYYMIKCERGRQITAWYKDNVESRLHHIWKYARWVVYVCIAGAIIIFLGVDVARNDPYNLVSISGIVFFLLFSFFYSKSPADIAWRTVYSGVVVQLVMGLIVLRWSAGADAIEWLANKISGFLNYGQTGARFLFGASYEEHGFAMSVMPILTWFNAVINLLLYIGALQHLVRLLGYILYFFMGTTPAEAFVAAADIFLGPESSILMIRPMVQDLTSSQLHSLITCGMASIDAGMIPLFESFGIPARHLLSASCMSAPSALMISKMVYPEEPSNSFKNQRLKLEKPKAVNAMDAFIQGARESVSIIANILAFLMTIVSLLEFVNTTLTWFGHRAGIEELTLQLILSYILTPVAFLMGVVWEDCPHVASLIGTKTIINEFVAYEQLAELIHNREQGLEPSITPRSETISAYALCGFSNFGTMGMMIAFLSTLVPNKKGDIARMAMRALVSSSIACFMTGCVAGVLHQD